MKKDNLSQDAIALLSVFLIENKKKNENSMNINMVQGFLYALISSPCLIMPSDWMFVIFGGVPTFQSVEQNKKTITAILSLYNSIKNKLLFTNKKDLSLWLENGQNINLNDANNLMLFDFCSGYVKGYLLDPILRDTCLELPDLSFAFFLSLIKLAMDKNTDLINNEMKKALQGMIVENYKTWSEVRKLNLYKTYFPDSLYK
jgi:yecA family protein